MAFQAVPDVAEAVIEYAVGTKLYRNVVHGAKPGGYNAGDLAILASAVDFEVSSKWLPQQTQDVAYVKTTVRGLAFENDIEVEDNTGAGPGAVLASALPGNVTISLKKASIFTGRSARGRLYWIGIPDTKLAPDENLIDTLYANDVKDAVDDVRNGITFSVWTAAIVSRFTGGVKRPTGVWFEWFTTELVNVTIDSMRSRLLP